MKKKNEIFPHQDPQSWKHNIARATITNTHKHTSKPVSGVEVHGSQAKEGASRAIHKRQTSSPSRFLDIVGYGIRFSKLSEL